MIKCRRCQAEHPENTLFCDECGYYLPKSNQEAMATLVVGEKMPWMEREETSEAPEERGTAPLGLKLTIPDSGLDVEVPLTGEVNIGRLDPVGGSFPEVDLTDYGGVEEGISRRHARITRQGNEVFVEDLASINGTFLNGKKLTPYYFEALKSGDDLQLGKLILRVNFL